MRGVLVVHIKRARNLVPRDKNGFSDPYAVVVVHGMRRFRTDVKYANLNPVWDQFGHYSGTLGSFVKSAMIVKLYDYDRLNFNDPLGVAAIDLTPLLEQSKLSARNVPLTGVDHGTIDVAVHFEQTAVNFAYPTPVAASAFEAIHEAIIDTPSDASWAEHQRDVLLAFLATHKVFTYITAVWIVAVVVWIILLVLVIPMNLGVVPWDAGAYGLTEGQLKHAWVVCNTVVCSLFTWQRWKALFEGYNIAWLQVSRLTVFECGSIQRS